MQARHVTERIASRFPGIACALQAAGAAIYQQSDDQAVFECSRAGSLVVLGKIFTKNFGIDTVPERAALDTAAATAACNSLGRVLVQRYWGRYVAFGHDAPSQRWFAVRDPSGDIPCYMITSEHLTLLFSNMEDCLQLRLRKFSINWQYLAYSLLLPFRDARQTGLREVTAVEAGEAVWMENGKPAARHCYWDVVAAAADDPITDLNEAVRLARSTLLGCIGALASQHTHIQLRLSGGLDSSIVLAGLLRAPSQPEVQCIHLYDSGIGADERTFARMAVAGAGRSAGRNCELHEYERTPHCSLEELLKFPRTARPAHGSGYILNRSVGPDAASLRTAQFTGIGGDAVFLRFKRNAGAIDYAWRHGIDFKLLRVAFESAQSGDSFYGALKDAFRHGVLKKSVKLDKTWGNPCEWIRAGAHPADMQPAWLRHALEQGHAVSPSKLAHIAGMVPPKNILDPFEGAGSWHGAAPIGAQPVIELFARIPLYVLMADAEDRTIARRAFAGLLPEPVLSRRVKSYLDDHSVTVTEHHRDFIRSMLVDGILAKHGFIDSAAADAGIQRVSPDHSSQVLGIFGPQLNIETWLRRWWDRRGDLEMAAS